MELLINTQDFGDHLQQTKLNFIKLRTYINKTRCQTVQCQPLAISLKTNTSAYIYMYMTPDPHFPESADEMSIKYP